MDDQTVTAAQWCKNDEHHHYDRFADFNEWIDNREGTADSNLLQGLRDSALSRPSKAFYAGDREAYEQAFFAYLIERRHEALSRGELIDILGDDDGTHWYERNEQRLEQLIEQIAAATVVPFIGAGVSASGGFPTWEDHLRQQGRTTGFPQDELEDLLSRGKHEAIIDRIENELGASDAFTQEIRDVFSRTGTLDTFTLLLAELFTDTLITTNYDRLLEQAFDNGSDRPVQVINSTEAMQAPDASCTTLYKLHGDVKNPEQCILGKAQYDKAYGNGVLNKNNAIPKLLTYQYQNSNLLFIGCSLNNDRTIQVFKAVKENNTGTGLPQHFAIVQAPETQLKLIERNKELAALGITAIWYPKDAHEKIEHIIRLAKTEAFRRKNQPNSENNSHQDEL